MRRLIRHWRPDVVHTHSSKAGILGRGAAWAEGVPVVVHTIHGLPFHRWQPGLVNAVYVLSERWAARRCHAIVSVADAMTQQALERDYRQMLGDRYGIVFSRLLTLANMPIQRFGSMLASQGRFDDYMALLREAHREENLDAVMCRDLVSVDWQGYLFDCDFNQMLGLPLRSPAHAAVTVRDLLGGDVTDWPIAVADHCFGCTAGQGSSCGGALGDAPETSRVASAAA
jgi:hypothetical protein